MKKVELSSEEKSMIKTVLEMPNPTKGYTIGDLRKIDKILNKIEEKLNETSIVEFDDDEFSFMMEKLMNVDIWMATEQARKVIIPMFDKLEKLQEKRR
ncbi:MAG: hypothetical protein ACTSX6_00215 [Candidatus Heimdallarchaeaceae archaeon]